MSKINAKHRCPVIGQGYGTEIVIVNAGEREWKDTRFVLWFGAYATTRLLVYADHLEDAFDEAIDWIAEHQPGMLCDDEVNEEYRRLVAEYRLAHPGLPEHEHEWPGVHQDAWNAIIEEAEQDTSSGGNASNRVLSYEWGIVCEDPDRATLLALAEVAQ